MEEKSVEKLFCFGKSNFTGNFIVKLCLGSNLTSDITKMALLVSEENIDNITAVELNAFQCIVASSEILNKLDNLKLDKNIKIFKSQDNISFFNEGDIVELISDDKMTKLFVLYRIKSNNNVIIATNHCNNKCIMCPQPIYINKQDDVNTARVEQIIKLMDKNTKYLTITGGEPTLLKEKLVQILIMCKKYLPNIRIQLLSNGRMFFYKSLVDQMNSVGIKFLELGIPIHSNNESIHDLITQIPKSFTQTITGVENLIASKNNVEIRIVIHKKNYLDLEKISDLIVERLSGIDRVSFMGMEMLGSAIQNSDDVWVPYKEMVNDLKGAILKLLTHNIKVSIYNIPLCKIDEDLRPLCAKSISDYKVRYLTECEECKEKNNCGGIFVSSLSFLKKEGINPII